MIDWRQETHNRSIADAMKTSDAAVEEANQSKEESELVTDEDENRKIITAEALKRLDEVKNFIEANGSDLLKIWKKLSSKIKNKVQSDIRSLS